MDKTARSEWRNILVAVQDVARIVLLFEFPEAVERLRAERSSQAFI